jgi:hypothetical protein
LRYSAVYDKDCSYDVTWSEIHNIYIKVYIYKSMSNFCQIIGNIFKLNSLYVKNVTR